ncbi:MAG: rRNA cytosine-C5-methyltransferase [Bacteroidales bacterium]|nr:rRNA cytosine-C5-methyltransferase [Candidatus Cryptobacteroides aphodequi]
MSDASVSIRLNPFKFGGSFPAAGAPLSSGQALVPDPFPQGEPVPWNRWGRILAERPSFTLDPLFHAGCYYVQDSSAMYVGHIFRKILDRCADRPLLRVLDLCAAPGGKTTDLAASLRERLGGSFLLVSNEVMKARVGVLDDNVALWGDPNVVVTSVDPAAFARLAGFFDIIVADVPCSGEGMFRKDERAVKEWSPAVVDLCAARQKRILADVWPALKPGGWLVYSTCTYERSENDDNLLWASRELGGTILEPENEFASYGVEATECGNLLRAGIVPGEGQWVGAMRKDGDTADAGPRSDRFIPASGTGTARYASPSRSAEVSLSSLHPIRQGVMKGVQKGDKFIPSADFALSLAYDGSYPAVEVDRMTALHFLHRDSFSLPDAPRGFVLISYLGHSLGFVNNLGNRCNNLHPQGRRILMNIA